MSSNSNSNSNSDRYSNRGMFPDVHSMYYRVIGPTDAHLVHEFFLLCCLVLFTIASMLSMYRYSFGTRGDWWLVGVTCVWLARHFVVRLICTCDFASRSCLRNWLTKYITAGQYFDPPTCFNAAEAASLFSSLLTAIDLVCAWVQTILSFLGRAFFYLRNLAITRTTPTITPVSTTTPTAPPTTTTTTTNTQNNQAHQILKKYWNSLPPIQLCVASIAFFLCCCGIYNLHSLTTILTGANNNNHHYHSYNYGAFTTSNFHNSAKMRNAYPISSSASSRVNINDLHNVAAHAAVAAQLAQYVGTPFALHHFVSGVAGKRGANHANTGNSYNNQSAMGPFGFESPTVWHYLLCISLWGTIASIILYGRIILPMPDLASNTSIASRLASINHTKSDILSSSSSRHTKGGGGASGGGGGVKYKNSHNNNNNNNNTNNNNNNNINNGDTYIPWAEQYKSINSENRFRLHCTVIIVRMIENVFVCLFLPQTPFGCRVTGHCEASSVIWGNDVTIKEKALYIKSSSMYDALPPDFLSNFTISLSIATVTSLLLWAQALALDKSHLSLLTQQRKKHQTSYYYHDNSTINTSSNTSTSLMGGDGTSNSKSNNNTNHNTSFSSGGGGTGGKRRSKGKGSGGPGGGGGGGNDPFMNNSNMMMMMQGGSCDNNNSSNNISSNSLLLLLNSNNSNNTDLYIRSMHEIFQYEMGHFSQSTVLVIITKIQLLCITIVAIFCTFRFLTSLNFLAISVALFANVLAVFAISGPTDTSELEQTAEEIRSGLMELDYNNNNNTNKGK